MIVLAETNCCRHEHLALQTGYFWQLWARVVYTVVVLLLLSLYSLWLVNCVKSFSFRMELAIFYFVILNDANISTCYKNIHVNRHIYHMSIDRWLSHNCDFSLHIVQLWSFTDKWFWNHFFLKLFIDENYPWCIFKVLLKCSRTIYEHIKLESAQSSHDAGDWLRSVWYFLCSLYVTKRKLWQLRALQNSIKGT